MCEPNAGLSKELHLGLEHVKDGVEKVEHLLAHVRHPDVEGEQPEAGVDVLPAPGIRLYQRIKTMEPLTICGI